MWVPVLDMYNFVIFEVLNDDMLKYVQLFLRGNIHHDLVDHPVHSYSTLLHLGFVYVGHSVDTTLHKVS